MANERDIIYFSKREGTQNDPYLDITEDLYIQYGKVFLKEIPLATYKVTVRNEDGSYMTEVHTDDELDTPETFHVNYRNGIVFFNGANNGLKKTFFYKGEGIILFPASRIYTNASDDMSQVETLQNAVGLAQNIQPTGTYDPLKAYKKGNIAFLEEVSYMALEDVTGISPPDATYWQVVLRGGLVGPKGDTGATGPKGDKGDIGNSLYTWIKYADTPTSGMSDAPEGKNYIGVASNQLSSTKSLVYADYSWSLIKGERGIKGDKGDTGATGATGPTLYTWVKYADSPTAGMSDSPSGKDYIGIASNKTTETKSTLYEDYAWSLFRGPQGLQGIQGIQGDKGDTGSTGSVVTTWKGAYDGVIAYAQGDLVHYEGRVYIAKSASTGNLPTDTLYWEVFVEKGTDGAGAVNSVNSKTGDIILTPEDIGSPSTSDFTGHTGNTDAHVTVEQKTTWDGKADKSLATSSVDGLMPKADKAKLDGITTTKMSSWDNKIDGSQKGVAGGVASLNASGNVIDASGNEITSTSDGGGSTSSSSYNVVNVKSYGALGDGSTDDATAIQNAINAVYGRDGGGTLYFPAGTYTIRTPLSVPDTWQESREVNWLGDGARVSRIRPLQAMECLLHLKGWGGYMKNIEFNGRIPFTGTNAAKYAVKADDVKEKVISGCNFNYANIHGFYLQGNALDGGTGEGNNNLMVFDQSCKFDQNGTVHSLTDGTGTSDTITFTNFNPVTAGVYRGAFVKYGTGKGSVYHIDAVTSTTVTISPNLREPLSTGMAFNIHMGDGLHLERGEDNNVFGIYDCHFVGNAAIGCTSRGLYGQNFQGGNNDYNGIAGLLIGSGMISITPSYSNGVYKGYFENNGYANIILDYPNGLDITEPILARPTDGTEGELDSIVSLRGYYFDYGYTSVTLGGRIYQYFHEVGNSETVELNTGIEHTVIRRTGVVTSPTVINLPSPPTHGFGASYEVFVDSSGGQPIQVKCATSEVNQIAGATGIQIPEGVGFKISIYYSKADTSWMVSYTRPVNTVIDGGTF
jgi:hypothetical protein